jgi:hypothetical protein
MTFSAQSGAWVWNPGDIAWMTILDRIEFAGLDPDMWGGGKRPAMKGRSLVPMNSDRRQGAA